MRRLESSTFHRKVIPALHQYSGVNFHPYRDKEMTTSKRKGPVEETLWTDKYRPRQFTDLLGDEVD